MIRTPLIGILIAMCLTSSAPADASYRAKAAGQSAFIQAHFYDAAAGLYRPSYPINPSENAYDFMWGNGVQLTALVGAARYDPKTYKPILQAFSKGLKKYWNETAPVPCFDAYWASPNSGEKYYDDNEWLVIGFAEAYALTKDPMFLDWARRTQDFAVSGWDTKLGGGIYWRVDHKTKNTCSNAPGATAALCLYRFGKAKSDLDWAIKIRNWTRERLIDTDGLFWDNISLNGTIQRTKWTYNTALMIRAEVLLHEFTGEKQYLDAARLSADAGIAAWVDSGTGALANSARFNHLFSEALLRLYDATKDIRYLNVVRRDAAFGYRVVRDPKGGYWNTWKQRDHAPDERKEMIENASVARLFWLLAPYKDAGELLAAGKKAAGAKDDVRAEDLLKQAIASDDAAVEAHYRLWTVLTRRHKAAGAAEQTAWLTQAAQSPDVAAQLAALGWKAAS